MAELVVAEALLIALGHHEEELVIAHPELGAIPSPGPAERELSGGQGLWAFHPVSFSGVPEIWEGRENRVEGNLASRFCGAEH